MPQWSTLQTQSQPSEEAVAPEAEAYRQASEQPHARSDCCYVAFFFFLLRRSFIIVPRPVPPSPFKLNSAASGAPESI